MKKSLGILFVGALVMAFAVSGCSHKPSAEELQQLEALKAEVSSLEKQIASLEADKASLTKSIAEKDAKLAQCSQDKTVVQQRLKAMQ